jgi:cytoskeleton protein RodZ
VAEVAAPASATGERVLTLRFSDECWVEAVDRGGAKLVSQIYARGSEARIAAPGPFEVVLGNAAVARATLDDQPFDLAPHVKVNVARFTVQ